MRTETSTVPILINWKAADIQRAMSGGAMTATILTLKFILGSNAILRMVVTARDTSTHSVSAKDMKTTPSGTRISTRTAIQTYPATTWGAKNQKDTFATTIKREATAMTTTRKNTTARFAMPVISATGI